MSEMLTENKLTQILDDLADGYIDITEAVRRANILDAEPDRYTCGTCRFLRAAECRAPDQPPRPEHPHSVRCGLYEWRDPRAEALPAEHEHDGNYMFK